MTNISWHSRCIQSHSQSGKQNQFCVYGGFQTTHDQSFSIRILVSSMWAPSSRTTIVKERVQLLAELTCMDIGRGVSDNNMNRIKFIDLLTRTQHTTQTLVSVHPPGTAKQRESRNWPTHNPISRRNNGRIST